jgi:hypothetical protein
MKKLSLFQIALPICIFGAYYAAIQFGMEPIPAAVSIAIIIFVAVAITSFLIESAAPAIMFATLFAILAAIGAFEASEMSFALLTVFTVIFAVLAAYNAQEKLHPRTGTVLLIAHNILYIGAIGLVFFFSMSDAYSEGGMLAVSIVLPFALLMSEIEAQQRESAGEEPH